MRIPLARWGLGVIAVVATGCVLLGALVWHLAGWYALLCATPAVFTLYFFRDPERTADEADAKAVLSPADGKVVAVVEEELPDGRRGTTIDIFLSIFDVHLNRAPVAGTVTATRYKKGSFLNALRAEAGEANESNAITLSTAYGEIEVKQIAGVIARRIVCAVREGQTLGAGERLGMIRFGSRTKLFVPAESGFEPSVCAGERVLAGKSVLGHVK